MSSRKRKSERIAIKSLSKFTNTEEDSIDLDTTDQSKQGRKKNMKQKDDSDDFVEKDIDNEDRGRKRGSKGTEGKEIRKYEMKMKNDEIVVSSKEKITHIAKHDTKSTKMTTDKVVSGKEKITHIANHDKKSTKGKEKMYASDSEDAKSQKAQLFRCVKLLRDNQKRGVMEMGFGNLLKFNMDGIPSKMAHFVVDRLKCKRMEIICRGGCLKITPQLIHKLLGIPIGGVKIQSIVQMEALDESVGMWRRQYEGWLLATRKIVEKIESSEDENTFDFKMYFLVLFIVVLVECHKNGRVKEGILRYITSQTDFSEIDWYDYIFESLRICNGQGMTIVPPSMVH
ncbi:hypothetical protein R6Q57_022988 [Mikania cordata]